MRARAREEGSGRVLSKTVCGRRHCRVCRRWRYIVDFSVRQWADKAKTRPRYLKAECQTCHARKHRDRWHHSPDYRRQRIEGWRDQRKQRNIERGRAFFTWWAENGHRWRPIYVGHREEREPPPRRPSSYDDDVAYYILRSLTVEPNSPARPNRGMSEPYMDFIEATEFRASDMDNDPRELEIIAQWEALSPGVREAIGRRALWPYVRDAYPGGFEGVMDGSRFAMPKVGSAV